MAWGRQAPATWARPWACFAVRGLVWRGQMQREEGASAERRVPRRGQSPAPVQSGPWALWPARAARSPQWQATGRGAGCAEEEAAQTDAAWRSRARSPKREADP